MPSLPSPPLARHSGFRVGLALLLTVAGSLLPSDSARGQIPGSLDRGFDVRTGFRYRGAVYDIAVQADGKVLLGGAFGEVNDQSRGHIVRLLADGTVDEAFEAYVNDDVSKVVVQADGRIVLAGVFSAVNRSLRANVARLHADGTLDESFVPPAEGTLRGSLLAVQADGKVLLRGERSLTRLKVDGTVDTGFPIRLNEEIYQLAVQPDGKILLAGEFTRLNDVERDGFARLNADGTLDTSFVVRTNPSIRALAVQPDGKILLGGIFTRVNDVPCKGLVRLLPDGRLDPGFDLGTSRLPAYLRPDLRALAVLPDGKIVVDGYNLAADATSVCSIARLFPDGTPDDGFTTANTDSLPAEALAVQSDGKILLGGGFDRVNGDVHPYVARLNGGPLPPAADADVTVSTSASILSRSYSDSATVTFARNGSDLSRTLHVGFSLSGPVVNGRDYQVLPPSRKIKAGRSTATVQIRPLPDGDNGKVKLTLLPGEGYRVGEPARVKVSIKD